MGSDLGGEPQEQAQQARLTSRARPGQEPRDRGHSRSDSEVQIVRPPLHRSLGRAGECGAPRAGGGGQQRQVGGEGWSGGRREDEHGHRSPHASSPLRPPSSRVTSDTRSPSRRYAWASVAAATTAPQGTPLHGIGAEIKTVPEGGLITGLVPNGPAAKAGLEPREMILEVNGTPFRDEPAFGPGGPLALIRSGDPIKLDTAGRRIDVLIDPAELEARRKAWRAPEPQHEDKRGYRKLFLDAVEQAECAGDLLCDHARRLLEASRQLERDRRAEIAERAVRRILEGDRGHGVARERVELHQHAREMRAQTFVDGKNHGTLSEATRRARA